MKPTHRTKAQFTGYLDTRSSEWEGVTSHHIEEAIDDMDEDELRRWMKMNFEVVLSSYSKD
jgi:hypothetical protein